MSEVTILITRRGVSRQLTLLKEVAPYTPVLVIGVTDMAR